MNDFNWESFLKQESRKAIAKYQEEKRKENKDRWKIPKILSPEVIESKWLGYPGASEAQIATVENRLGIRLPPSYRDFLKITNGWNNTYPGIPILHPVEEIDWFYVENQDVIDEYNQPLPYSSTISDEEYLVYDFPRSPWVWGQQPLRTEYMQTALQISDDDDCHFVLLNPKIIHDSEWETWIFMSGDGDVKRYRSFEEMVKKNGMVNSWV